MGDFNLLKTDKMNRNFLATLVLCIFLVNCKNKTASKITSSKNLVDAELNIPDITVDKSDLNYSTKKSLWTLNDQLYSGYSVSFYPDSTLKEKFGILKGRKQHEAIQWYADGHYKNVTSYHNGKAHGDKKLWSPDSLHTLVAHYKYDIGKPHGEQIKWYSTGELFKKLNLNMGKEEGIQQAFRKNGALYANYEAKNGRIFGLKKTTLCYSLEDENIQYYD